MSIEVDIQTRQAVEYLVRELPRFQQDKAIKEGLGQAAKIFEALGRANLAGRFLGYQTGKTLRSFATKVSVVRRGGAPMAAAGLRWPEGYKAHWLDRGTGPRYTKSGAYRGFLIPNNFFQDAREEGERPAMDAIIDGVRQAVARLNSRR